MKTTKFRPLSRNYTTVPHKFLRTFRFVFPRDSATQISPKLATTEKEQNTIEIYHEESAEEPSRGHIYPARSAAVSGFRL